MRRIQRYNLLSVLGDMKNHPYAQVVNLATLHFSNPLNRKDIWGSERIPNKAYMSIVIEQMIKRLFDDGLIKRVDTEVIKNARLQKEYQLSPLDYDLVLTEKGRALLGDEQIARAGDYSWYKRYQGTLDSAKKINPNLFK